MPKTILSTHYSETWNTRLNIFSSDNSVELKSVCKESGSIVTVELPKWMIPDVIRSLKEAEEKVC